MDLQSIIDESEKIVFFGGAGVSTESGIPDFRSQDGLYNMKYKYPPEQIISHSFFMADPEEFFRFYRDRMIYPAAKPNAAHLKLAELERAGKLSAVVTQNIDGLHSDAGSKNVIELHGSVRRNHCMKCGKSYGLEFITSADGVPRCSCGGIVKPDVVLYEEPLKLEDFSRHGFCGMNGTGVCGNADCENYQPSGNYMEPPTCAVNGCTLYEAPQSWCYVEERRDSE